MSPRDTILNHKPTIEAVEAFGGTVFVREMAGDEVVTFQKYLADHEDRTGMNVYCGLLVRTLCDERGVRHFQDDEAHLLAGRPIQHIRKAYAVAERLNAVTDEDVEQAEGNSDATTC